MRPTPRTSPRHRETLRRLTAGRGDLAGAFHVGVEQALVEERASALGRIGRRLEDALAQWRRVRDAAADGRADDPAEVDAALDAVARATHDLLIQRECSGFRMNNLAWIREHYDVPGEALRRI